MSDIDGYIYLLKLRESIENNETIYKLGRTQQDSIGRFTDYPKNSKLILHIECVDSVCLEKQLLKIFSKLFVKCDRCHLYGNEYFSGDYHQMMQTILSHLNFACSLEESKHVRTKINNMKKELQILTDENTRLRNNVSLQEANDKIKLLEKQLYEMKLQAEYAKEERTDLYIDKLQDEVIKMKVENQESLCDEVEKEKEDETQDVVKNQCSKCKKVFVKKSYLRIHEAKCNGLHPLQCEICHKYFTSSSGKSHHKRFVTCIPAK